MPVQTPLAVEPPALHAADPESVGTGLRMLLRDVLPDVECAAEHARGAGDVCAVVWAGDGFAVDPGRVCGVGVGSVVFWV